MLPHAVHAMLADMLSNPTRTQKQRKSCDVTHSGYETPEEEVTKVQDWVSKHGISSAENKAGQMGLMLADDEETTKRISPKYREDRAPAMPTNAIATTHQNNEKRKRDVKGGR